MMDDSVFDDYGDSDAFSPVAVPVSRMPHFLKSYAHSVLCATATKLRSGPEPEVVCPSIRQKDCSAFTTTASDCV
jgi:hypothetical protein